MTPKELGELGHLEAAVPVVDPADFPPVEADEALEPGQRKSVDHPARLRRPRRRTSPSAWSSTSSPSRVAIEGDGKAERIIVERTGSTRAARARGTGETYEVPASLIVSCDRLFDAADRRRAL